MKISSFLLILFIIPAMAIAQTDINHKGTVIFEPKYLHQYLNSEIFRKQSSSINQERSIFIHNQYLMNSIYQYKTATIDIQNSAPDLLFSPYREESIISPLSYYKNYGLSLIWHPYNNLLFEGRTFISLQKAPLSGEILFGGRSSINYNIVEKLWFKAWAQYITPSNNDPIKIINRMYPNTNAGAALIVEPRKNMQVGAGVEYQMNQKNKKWESRSGGRVSIGF